jgi:hypothetical protein
MMKRRTGRPPKQASGSHTTITLKVPAQMKAMLIEQSEAYDMSITEYLTTLVERDALQS